MALDASARIPSWTQAEQTARQSRQSDRQPDRETVSQDDSNKERERERDYRQMTCYRRLSICLLTRVLSNVSHHVLRQSPSNRQPGRCSRQHQYHYQRQISRHTYAYNHATAIVTIASPLSRQNAPPPLSSAPPLSDYGEYTTHLAATPSAHHLAATAALCLAAPTPHGVQSQPGPVPSPTTRGARLR